MKNLFLLFVALSCAPVLAADRQTDEPRGETRSELAQKIANLTQEQKVEIKRSLLKRFSRVNRALEEATTLDRAIEVTVQEMFSDLKSSHRIPEEKLALLQTRYREVLRQDYKSVLDLKEDLLQAEREINTGWWWFTGMLGEATIKCVRHACGIHPAIAFVVITVPLDIALTPVYFIDWLIHKLFDTKMIFD